VPGLPATNALTGTWKTATHPRLTLADYLDVALPDYTGEKNLSIEKLDAALDAYKPQEGAAVVIRKTGRGRR